MIVPRRLAVVRLSLAVAAVVAVVVACAWIGGRADREAAMRAPATCRAGGCYCEAVADSGVRQPIDAWSSLAPALAGAVVLALALGPRRRGGGALDRSRVPELLLGVAACAIAVFSFHYHATLTWLGEWLDGVALYLLAGFPIACAVARAANLGGRGFGAIYGALAAVPAGVSWLLPAARKPAFLAIAALAIVIVLIGRRRRAGVGDRWLVLALGSFGVAGTAWMLDATRTVCAPHGPFQLHALWHMLSAPTIIALRQIGMIGTGGRVGMSRTGG